MVFEYGYLNGKSGRDRVCAWVKKVEIPSDICGVFYKTMDSAEAWKTKILKERKNVGIAVDAKIIVVDFCKQGVD